MSFAVFLKLMPGTSVPALPGPSSGGSSRLMFPTPTEGAFDVALFSSSAHAVSAAEAALAWLAGAPEIAPAAVSAAGPPELDRMPIHVFRAMDGWLAVAFPDRQAWHAFSMAFLRRGLFRSVPHDAAWHSTEANELAMMVLDTHHAEDAAGTAQTYGVPCVALPRWQDDAQAVALGVAANHTPSFRLADTVRYGALVSLGGALLPDEGGFRHYLRRLAARAGADIVVPEPTP